jgi:hypothetical protein
MYLAEYIAIRNRWKSCFHMKTIVLKVWKYVFRRKKMSNFNPSPHSKCWCRDDLIKLNLSATAHSRNTLTCISGTPTDHSALLQHVYKFMGVRNQIQANQWNPAVLLHIEITYRLLKYSRFTAPKLIVGKQANGPPPPHLSIWHRYSRISVVFVIVLLFFKLLDVVGGWSF